MRATEDERLRIARELHDTMGSTLAALKLWLDVAAGADPARSADALRRAHEGSRLAIDELRAVVATMDRSPLSWPLARSLLERRLTGLCEAAGVNLHLRIEAPPEATLPAESGHHLLKLVEEAAANAVRHGHPRTLEVSLAAGPRLQAEIVDDGQGLDVDEVLRRGGLRSLRERARSAGGALVVESGGGRTRVAWGAADAIDDDAFDDDAGPAAASVGGHERAADGRRAASRAAKALAALHR